jgi:hypothetical protein
MARAEIRSRRVESLREHDQEGLPAPLPRWPTLINQANVAKCLRQVTEQLAGLPVHLFGQ